MSALPLQSPTFRSALNELCQRRRLNPPTYCTLRHDGQSHQPIITVSCEVAGFDKQVASGSSVKEAKECCAKILFEMMRDIDSNEVEQLQPQPKQPQPSKRQSIASKFSASKFSVIVKGSPLLTFDVSPSGLQGILDSLANLQLQVENLSSGDTEVFEYTKKERE